MSRSANMKKPPTPAEVQQEQDRMVALDAQRAAVPAVVAPAQYVDQIAPQTLAGKMLKFTKDGKFAVPDNETEIGEDVQFIALVPETLIGWVKFNDPGNPPEKFMGLLYDGYRMPERSELGDLDEAAWEMGLDGRPGDPWNHAIYLVLQRVDNSELFTFVAMSKTSRRAVGVVRAGHSDCNPLLSSSLILSDYSSAIDVYLFASRGLCLI
jgi:hypothetical protein